MKKILKQIFFLLLFFMTFSEFSFSQHTLKHFIFFSREREGILNSDFFMNPRITGAQITYPWKRLEPRKDQYDFSEIEEDLLFLESKGKKLFIQIQDVTFDSTVVAVPKYLITDTVYHGGVNSQYDYYKNGKPFKAGWVARRWDPEVSDRFYRLLEKLAGQFDGRIEGINLPETSMEFPKKPGLLPDGFTDRSYTNAIKMNMLTLKTNFKQSVPLLYANFMPGDSKESLREIYDYSRTIRLGMGGPDIKVYRPAQMENSYPLIRAMAGIAPTGVAVQEGNYSVINPKSGKKVTVPEILGFAEDYLKLEYIFWCTEEPYYSKEVLPLLRSLKK